MTNKELTEKISYYHELQRLIEEAKAEMESISDGIKAEMAARETNELVAGEYKVTWTPYTTSRFDAKGLKTANPELYTMFCKVTQARRFAIN